jgi:hypothetical protein
VVFEGLWVIFEIFAWGAFMRSREVLESIRGFRGAFMRSREVLGSILGFGGISEVF